MQHEVCQALCFGHQDDGVGWYFGPDLLDDADIDLLYLLAVCRRDGQTHLGVAYSVAFSTRVDMFLENPVVFDKHLLQPVLVHAQDPEMAQNRLQASCFISQDVVEPLQRDASWLLV